MGLIIIADTLYYRYAGLRHILLQGASSPLPDIVDLYGLKRLYHSRYYDKVLIIGNPALCELHKINKLVSRNNDSATIRRIFFSDIINLQKLSQNIVIDSDNIIVPSDVSITESLVLSKAWINGFNRDRGVCLYFNKKEREVLEDIEYGISNKTYIRKSKRINARRLVVSRLKRKFNIRSEYSLYLLWMLFKKIDTLS